MFMRSSLVKKPSGNKLNWIIFLDAINAYVSTEEGADYKSYADIIKQIDDTKNNWQHSNYLQQVHLAGRLKIL